MTITIIVQIFVINHCYRLTHSSYSSGWCHNHPRHGDIHQHHHHHHHEYEDDSVDNISYEQLEARLPQPSQMYLNFKPLLTGVAPVSTTTINNIFQKVSDLVQHVPAAVVTTNNNVKQTEHDLTEDWNNDNNTHETDVNTTDDKRPVSDCHVCGDRQNINTEKSFAINVH